MDNDRRFEISNKIIAIDQIEEISDYLQKTKNSYIMLIKDNKQKNNSAYFNQAEYEYYAYSDPKVEYTISYLDGREIKTEDSLVFKDTLSEPQYLKRVVLQIYINYKDNKMNEVTEHSMSLYLSLDEKIVFFSTSDKNMNDPAYNLNSYVRCILEKGQDRFNGIAKNRLFVKGIFGLAVGIIIIFILFFIILLTNSANSTIALFLSNGVVSVLFGWFIAFAIGNIITAPIMGTLYSNIDIALNSSIGGVSKIREEEYKKTNEVLIGRSYNNLQKRKSIQKIYQISKKIILIEFIVSILIIVILSVLK